ncbi:hypothetical protein L914_06181 [Phytophthora nicotianae]|uniref:Uncharacterized protein n=1 Tax=Phytophthora nicotianae TaxID=4792 RepID=W2NNS4_PHYNI|nr:hypothetical protein L914_06181 [Phytophthora nicotianae]
MASLCPSASSRALLVELQSTAGLRATKSWLARASLARPTSETSAKQPQAATQPASRSSPPSPPLPSPPSPPSSPSAVDSPAASPASALSAGSLPSPLNTAPSLPLDDVSVASDVSSEESEEDDSEGLRAARPPPPPPPPPPLPSASGLFDDDSDEETESVGGLNRLRRSTDSGDWHLTLGLLRSNVEQLHDVRGEYPHRCFLVEWQITPLQMSWVWEEQLAQRFARRIDQVMQWCEDLRPGAFANYYKKHFARRVQASPAGDCFMDAFRAALYHLGDPGLASTATELWVDFEREHPGTVDRVSRGEATEFFRVLQRSNFPLDFDLLFHSPLDATYTKMERFQAFVQTPREGVYLTSIEDGLVGHCVVVLAKGPDTTASVLDEVEPPVTPEHLTNLEYLHKVKWMELMKLIKGTVVAAVNASPG